MHCQLYDPKMEKYEGTKILEFNVNNRDSGTWSRRNSHTLIINEAEHHHMERKGAK